jgi:hypothetical protein
MTDDDLSWSQPIDDPTRPERPPKSCRHPFWVSDNLARYVDGVAVSGPMWCGKCGKVADPERQRRGKSSRRLGSDQERRIERVYGPRKVGEFGDAVDHIGRDFVWQSKASRSLPPQWLAAISKVTFRAELPKNITDPWRRMVPIAGSRAPLVIRSYVRQGVNTRDWLFIRHVDWALLRGLFPVHGYMVIPGSDFLAIHGTDAEAIPSQQVKR